MLSDGDPRQIRKRIFICACVPAIDLFDDILIHRKRLIYELRTNVSRSCTALPQPGQPGRPARLSQSLGLEPALSPHTKAAEGLEE